MSYSQGDSRKFVASAMGNGRYGGGSVSSAPEASLTAPVSPTTLSTDSEDGGARLSSSPVANMSTGAYTSGNSSERSNTGFVMNTNDDVFSFAASGQDKGFGNDLDKLTTRLRDAPLGDSRDSSYSHAAYNGGSRNMARSVTLGGSGNPGSYGSTSGVYGSGLGSFGQSYGGSASYSGAYGSSSGGYMRQTPGHIGGRDSPEEIDPQKLYPSSACIFVANLPEPVDDTTLSAEVTRQFARFGVVHVKVRRDRQNMPFAFVQYKEDAEAADALLNGRGVRICGRPCRTERAKANCNVIISKRHGGDVTREEVLAEFDQFGPFEMVDYPEGTRESMIVRCEQFADARELQTAYHHHPVWRAESYDPTRRETAPHTDPNQRFLDEYDIKRRSVYVGGLLVGVTEEQIAHVFGRVGRIRNIQIVDKTAFYSGPGASRVFAFVEYERPDTPDIAVQQLNGVIVNGLPVRVERKSDRFDKQREPRRVQSQYPMQRPYMTDANQGMAATDERRQQQDRAEQDSYKIATQAMKDSDFAMQVGRTPPSAATLGPVMTPGTTMGHHQNPMSTPIGPSADLAVPAQHTPTHYGYMYGPQYGANYIPSPGSVGLNAPMAMPQVPVGMPSMSSMPSIPAMPPMHYGQYAMTNYGQYPMANYGQYLYGYPATTGGYPMPTAQPGHHAGGTGTSASAKDATGFDGEDAELNRHPTT